MISTEVQAALERVVQRYLAALHRASVRLSRGNPAVAESRTREAVREGVSEWAGLGTKLYELAGAAGVWAGSADDTP